MSKMVLMEVSDDVDKTPGAFKETAAARYLSMGKTRFRELVDAGEIPFVVHLNGKVRIYLRAHLDSYLKRLDARTIGDRGKSPIQLQQKESACVR